MAVRFDFKATIRHFSVFRLTFNMFVNKHSDFMAPGLLTGVDVRGTLGLLSVTPYRLVLSNGITTALSSR